MSLAQGGRNGFVTIPTADRWGPRVLAGSGPLGIPVSRAGASGLAAFVTLGRSSSFSMLSDSLSEKRMSSAAC